MAFREARIHKVLRTQVGAFGGERHAGMVREAAKCRAKIGKEQHIKGKKKNEVDSNTSGYFSPQLFLRRLVGRTSHLMFFSLNLFYNLGGKGDFLCKQANWIFTQTRIASKSYKFHTR